MSARQLVLLAALGGLGYVAWRVYEDGGLNVAEPVNADHDNVIARYLSRLANIESGGRPYVKAATSSGSGLYQFLKATWTGEGGAWGPDPSKAFGGLTPSIAEQTARAATFTTKNLAQLVTGGIPVNPATLYAAHFLGAATAKTVLHAPLTDQVAAHVNPAVITANPFLKGMTVAGFQNWLTRKAGV